MSNFKVHDNKSVTVQVTPPPEAIDLENRIFKLDTGNVQQVSEFKFGDLRKPGKLSTEYHVTANVQEQRHLQKDQRFKVDPLLKNRVSVDEEKNRRIEETVRAEITARAEKAEAVAREKGYQQGLKNGHQEASDAFQIKADAMAAQIEEFMTSCEAKKDEIFKANERFLIELIYRMGKMVTLKELSTDREYLAKLVNSLVEKVGAKDNIRFLINPADLAKVAELKNGLEDSFGKLKNLTFEASEMVMGGGCVIETNWSAMDASVETQLTQFRNALIGSEAPESTSGAVHET